MVGNQNEKRNSTLRTKSGQKITNCGDIEPICGGILPLFDKPACGEQGIVFDICAWVVHACVHASVQICPGHNLYIYAWVLK